MKRIFLFISCCFLLSVTAFAQKQTAGNITAEVSILKSGINANVSSLNNVIEGAKLRYFFTDDLALRFGLNFSGETDKHTATQNADGTGEVGEGKATSSKIVILPGIEKHFGAWNKVSPYVGLDLSVGFYSAEEKRDQLTNNNSLGNSTFQNNLVTTFENFTFAGDRAGTSFGFNILTGVDFYVTGGLFLGVEMGIGFNTFTTKDTTRTNQLNNIKTVFVTQGGTNSGFTPNIVQGIRLGWNFGTGSGLPRGR